MMGYYRYVVEFYDDLEDCKKEEGGLVCADSYCGVIKNLLDYYGESNIEAFKLLEPTEQWDSPVITVAQVHDAVALMR